MTVSNKPGHRGEREVSRKTIARGMPGRSGVTVVTTLVCFVLFRTRDCGRIGRPAFPAPSDFKGGWFLQNLGRIAPRECRVISGIRRRHCEPTGRANARPMTGSAKIPWGVDSDQV